MDSPFEDLRRCDEHSKIKYASKKLAKRALKTARFQRPHWQTVDLPVRYYYEPECGWYHLTRKPRWVK